MPFVGDLVGEKSEDFEDKQESIDETICNIKSMVGIGYWAIAAPTYAMVTIVLAMVFYIGQNFMATPPPTSLNTMFDEYSREHSSVMASLEEDEQPIEPISDIGTDQLNELMFNSLN
ncbi:hypothetical protein IFM89_033211 [Coptis chinensis]|uniref:PIG-P domain-containing protein n=1 Tax=Coptis chinensis TaxID=261450 RepID=A0A835ME57_9MAGN|nr:hypothetical protein IFM89_033211 [Coptis chinensis]